jgi:hypothetical protein
MSQSHSPTEFQGPIFAEPQPGGDPLGFSLPHGSDDPVYKQIGDLLKKQVVPFPKSLAHDDSLLTLADIYGSRGDAVAQAIKSAGRIVFHAVGDTGASDTRKYKTEINVADQLSTDATTAEANNRPAFFLHLGDVVYSFGESEYYYDQFYEAYRDYPGPILAIAGNHDSFVVPGTPAGKEPLTTFMRNFCSEKRVITPEARSLHRTAMTLPGLYYAVDAPFVRVISLFSNALEDPGLISDEGGRWPGVPDYQLAFLTAQLQKIKDEHYSGAIIIATHHPAFAYRPGTKSATSNHSSSVDMLREIDEICAHVGVYPHAFLSGHAHSYQRYTRTVEMGGKDMDVPFVICGNGGHNVTPLVRGSRTSPAVEPENGSDVSYLDVKPAVTAKGLTLEKYDDHEYGYLRVTADAKQLRIAYHQAGVRSLLQSRYDLVTLDLATRAIVAN